ncbi:MAG TPA: class I SAM-dependent methyltransferase [Fluviicola sp.]|nr:class I SAM-dependent methyltransferase [Fluviicola sp.]
MSETVKAYYDRIGKEYDDDRFGKSSYGQYIHKQECAFLDKWIPENPSKAVLDMGCGTGRFMTRATDGVDFSEGMTSEAKQKFPEKNFHLASITDTGLPSGSFEKAFSMHVLMHLDQETTAKFLDEAHRLLAEDGLFVVDFPSAKRRSFGQRKVKGTHWHGSNAQNTADLLRLGNEDWKLISKRGILFFPIHRFPVRIRPFMRFFDNIMCRSFLKGYASYVVVVLQRA